MRHFVLRLFAVIGLVVVILAAGGAAIWFWLDAGGASIADKTILTLNLDKSLPDAPPDSGIASLVMGSQQPLSDVLDALEQAGNDDRVKGLVARIGDGGFDFAEIQELRDAIAAFRAKGKRAIAYTDSFGELGSGTRGYYLASAFDEIWLQPFGQLGLVGLRAEIPFVRGTLDKLGVVPDFEHREDFKTAMNTFTETAMTPAQREETHSLLTSIEGQIVHGIATDRKIDETTLRGLIDRGPLLTQEAVDAHLVDHLGYRDDAIAALRKSAGSDAKLLSLADYLDKAGRPHRSGPTIALIYGTGLIVRGGGSGSLLGGSRLLDADRIVRAFHTAAHDKSVRAILFRIDSPGGSAVASETIWRAVKEAHDAGKPVIVSMGDVAGSGGYYIAAPADKIVAEPATLTASIGVVAGKVVVNDFLAKLGVSFGVDQLGANAGIASMLQDFTPQEHARFEAMLDDIYAGFKSRVAEGRKLSPGAVEKVAQGRVWTGEQAKSRGLVDALGGFSTALALAKQAAKIPDNEDVTLKLIPPAHDAVGTILARLLGHDDDSDKDSAGTLTGALATIRPLVQSLALLLAPPGALVMPPMAIK